MQKTRILLIKPRDEADFLNSSITNKVLQRAAVLPSLSLMTVAALTPTDDFVVEILDEALGVSLEDACIDADIYALTCFDPSRHRAHAICRWLKAQGRFVVLGGSHATQHYASILETEPYDVVFAGEAEHTWPQFLRDYQQKTHRPLYHQTEWVDLAHTPVARYDLCSGKDYMTAVIQTSRGCPYRCDFCNSLVLSGHRVRTRPVDRVIEEIDQVYRQGYTSVLIGDDNFTAPRKNAKEVLGRIVEWRKDKDPLFMVAAQVSIDVARDDELCELMVRAGLVFVYIGIESASKAALAGAKKLHNLRSDIPSDVAKLHAYGINVMSGFIVGFDEDGPEIFGESVDYLDRLSIPVCGAFPLMAPEGTPLRERLEREGRIDGNFVSEELFETNVIPLRLRKEDLTSGLRWMTTHMFDTRGFARRIAEKFEGFRSLGVEPAGATTWDIRMRHYKLAWTILGFCARHPRMAQELAEPLARIAPTMVRHPRLVPDMFNDVLQFVRMKSYYRQAGMYQEALYHEPRPESWMHALDVETPRCEALPNEALHQEPTLGRGPHGKTPHVEAPALPLCQDTGTTDHQAHLGSAPY